MKLFQFFLVSAISLHILAKSAHAAPSVPAPTDLFMYSEGPTQMTVQWASGGGDTAGYYLAYAGGASPTACTNGSRIAATSFSRSDLAANAKYTVSVCAYDSRGNVSKPVIATETTLGSQLPVPVPRNLTVNADSQTQLTMRWQSSGGTTVGFIVSFATGATTPATCGTGIRVPTTSYTRTGLAPNSTYTVSVCAYDNLGNVSPAISVTASTLGTSRFVAPPRNLVVTPDSQTQLTLRWLSGGGTTAGFMVAFSGTSTPAPCTNGIRVSGTSYTRSDLAANSTYTVTVCAYDQQGNVSSGISAAQTTQASTRFVAPPHDLVVLGFGNQLSISWESSEGRVAGYMIAFAAGRTPNVCTNGIRLGVTNQFVRSDLGYNATYTITVCAYDDRGNVSSGISVSQTTGSQAD